MHKIRILAIMLTLPLAGVNGAAVHPQADEAQADIPVKGYNLVWSDEFNGTTLDSSKWGYRCLGPRRDAINVKDTVSLDGKGNLVLTTKRSGDAYHTAMIGTEGKFETTFGYFECRVQLQKEIGHWSAFWIQSPTNGKPLGNPAVAGTEIDIYEYHQRLGEPQGEGKGRSESKDIVVHNIHWDGFGEHHKQAHGQATVPGLLEGWHTFSVLWTEDEYIFYVDRKETCRMNQAISKRPQYMILSLEVGKWAGDISEAVLPDSLYVDYVRVYQKSRTEK